ncbi:DNA polymerase III subunit epsilon [Gammaproteobacteria bacterium 45_16_T64]|nr:DNA polymerase III subunit epsilon [Gammaproteobacteria bacterium 45_16_T64]
MRQIVLDTETTGLEPSEGHRIIEIGCVEVVDRRLTGNTYHQYLNPDRAIDDGAIEVHGITNEFLVDKPRFNEVAGAFLDFIKDSQLVIHNAPFDVGFMDHEFAICDRNFRTKYGKTKDYATVLDTLLLARKMHPGQRNSLDALCKRYEINNTHRELHGALLDSEILADVYLAMTGGQTALILGGEDGEDGVVSGAAIRRLDPSRQRLPVLAATEQEMEDHRQRIEFIANKSGGESVWGKVFPNG